MKRKTYLSCRHWPECSLDRQRRCRVWGTYRESVLDLVMWEGMVA